MKKLFAILLVGIMILSFAACGGEKTDEPDNTKTSSVGETDDKSDSATDTSDGATDEPSSETGKEIKTTLLTLNYDDSVWTNIEDDFVDNEDYSFIKLQIPDPDEPEYYLFNAVIEVSIDEPYSFREDLVYYGFDQYDYKVNNAYETVNIGGVDLLKYDDGEETLIYFNRIEGANATVYINIDATDIADSRIEELLKGLAINLEDIGNVDGPWEWEGEAFSAPNTSAMTGTYTVNSQWLPITECITTSETFDHAVAVVGDKAYILGEETLKQYAYDGESLVYEKDIDVSGNYTNIQSTADGTIWISGFMEPLVCFKDGVQTASYEDTDIVTMHPTGAWGINWFSGSECQKVTINNGTLSTSPITFAEVSTISSLCIDENYIYVSGSSADDSGHKVYVYNADGALQMTLTDADGEGLGSITYITQTANGILGMDGNLREVTLWGADGTFIGTIEDGDLFGTNYPWFCSGTKLSDGSILVVMTEDRADKSAMELVAFKLSGF